MNKRFWICGLVMSVAALVLDFIVHGLLLRPDYAALVESGFVRGPQDTTGLPWMMLAHVLIGFGMTWLYRESAAHAHGNAWHGLRFGFAIAVVSVLPMYLIYYAVQPWPALLVVKQLALGLGVMLLLGLLVSYLQPRRVVL